MSNEVHLLATPRSGSTVTTDYLADRLTACGVNILYLKEYFSHVKEFVDSENGPIIARTPKQISKEEKLSWDVSKVIPLYEKYHYRHKLVKNVIVNKFHPIVDYINSRNNSKWLLLKRDSILDQVTSFCISIHSDIWHLKCIEDIEWVKQNKIDRFVAKKHNIKNYIEFLKTYDQLEQRLVSEGLVIGFINYNSIKQDCDNVSQKLIDFYGCGNVNRWHHNSDHFWLKNNVTTLKKLWTLEEKVDMIINIDEVKDMIISHGLKVE